MAGRGGAGGREWHVVGGSRGCGGEAGRLVAAGRGTMEGGTGEGGAAGGPGDGSGGGGGTAEDSGSCGRIGRGVGARAPPPLLQRGPCGAGWLDEGCGK